MKLNRIIRIFLISLCTITSLCACKKEVLPGKTIKLSKKEIISALVKIQLDDCFHNTSSMTNKVIKVRIKVLNSGEITEAQVVTQSLKDDVVTTCISQKIKQHTFRSFRDFRDSDLSFVFPFKINR